MDAKSTNTDHLNVLKHRVRLQAQAPVSIQVDEPAAALGSAAHRESQAVASSPRASDDQAFIDAASGWQDE